jgi:3'(2'), 5'-bisphosphate nucleotidase
VASAADHQESARIAAAAGALLLDIREQLSDPAVDVEALRREGDRRSHDFIVGELAKAYPDDSILSEEGKPNDGYLASRRVWIVDPLDGTREFGEAGRTDWAVHVALSVDGQVVAGAVALPGQEITLSSASPPQPANPGRERPCLVVSRTRPPKVAQELAASLGADLLAMGSAGAKVAAVVLGEADVYVHAGGQHEWDSAAPVAVATAAGFHASRVDGSPLLYNQPGAWLPDLLVCRSELKEALLDALRTCAVD